jgi:GcrA cell cycle regulator
MNCKFCGGEGHACQTCIDGIVARMTLGESAASIAASLSTGTLCVTRNMIIGLWNRNKPEGVFHPTSNPKTGQTRAKNRVREAVIIKAMKGPSPTHAGLGDTAILKLERKDCRFPVGDPQHDNFHFCSHPQRPGSPYCEYHHAKTRISRAQAKRNKEKRRAANMPTGTRLRPPMAHQ